MRTPKVIAIVLTWNQKDISIRCIESVLASQYDNLELLVVDNGSTDGLVSILKEQYGHHHLVLNSENLGYVGGNNRGIEVALKLSADYLFVLNNDVVVEPDAIQTLVTYGEKNRSVGLFGPVVHDTTTHRPDNYGWRFNRPKGELTKVRQKPSGCNGFVPTDVVPGCSQFLRADLIPQVGMLDERMFIFWEDTDLSLRFKRLGWGVGIVSDAVVWHENALTVPKDSPPRIYYNFRNHLLLMQKHGTLRDWTTFAPYFIANDILDIVKETTRTLRAQPRSSLRKLAACFSGVLAFGLRRWGKGPDWLYK